MTESAMSSSHKTYKKNLLAIAIVICMQCTFLVANPLQNIDDESSNQKQQNNDFEFIILHNNDMHGRFEETGSRSLKCTPTEKATKQCYGGFARISHEVKKYRELSNKSEGIPVLYLNAGDTYTGTPWFTIFKDKITADFLNALQPDAMSLGNHEFDEGVEGLIPFLDAVQFPVLAANLNLTNTPELAARKSLRKSVVFILNKIKVGIIGYLTPDTKFLTYPNSVDYFPEIDSINEEAKVLKNMGINIIIALGHSGYQKDMEIAKYCPDIDLVIGGHTNTFLYNGKPPDSEIVEGPYPTIVEQSNGKKVPVVQAFAYTKYLGYLKVKFSTDGNLVSWGGQPILLDSSIPQDPVILQLLEKYRPNITALETVVVGRTLVELVGRSKICRSMECNLGNLIADAMVYATMSDNQEYIEKGWTNAAIAFVQGGGIRSSILKPSDGSIRKTDLVAVLPFNNPLYVIEVSGNAIKRALEKSASLLGVDSNGGFLQMSGVQVIYDQSKPIGHRVLEVNVKCADCDVPQYFKLDENKKYKIILNAFILAGGDGYKWLDSPNPIANATPIHYTELEAVVRYIHKKSPVYPAIEQRIKIIGDLNSPTQDYINASNQFSSCGIFVISILLLTRIL